MRLELKNITERVSCAGSLLGESFVNPQLQHLSTQLIAQSVNAEFPTRSQRTASNMLRELFRNAQEIILNNHYM